jgi:hypothetical protein
MNIIAELISGSEILSHSIVPDTVSKSTRQQIPQFPWFFLYLLVLLEINVTIPTYNFQKAYYRIIIIQNEV